MNNSLLKIDDKLFFHKALLGAGAFYVHSFFDTGGILKDFRTFVTEFRLNHFHFTQYLGVIHSMPNSWKTFCRYNESLVVKPNSNEVKYLMYISNSTPNKAVYLGICKKHNCTPSSIRKWQAELNYDLDWNKVFLLPFKSIKECKLQYFQYRFIHRILAVNEFLFKINYVSSPLCSFCDVCIETINHLFWDCPIVKRFWNAPVIKVIKHKVVLSESLVFFGEVDNYASPLNFF